MRTTPLPTPNAVDTYWDQCQHQSWFFPPWHRGYLVALEAKLREDIKKKGGPSTWALPYWDYFGPANQFDIPPAFTQPKMPDGTDNPLFVTARYGPNGNSTVFVPTPAGLQQRPLPPPNFFGPVTDACLTRHAPRPDRRAGRQSPGEEESGGQIAPGTILTSSPIQEMLRN